MKKRRAARAVGAASDAGRTGEGAYYATRGDLADGVVTTIGHIDVTQEVYGHADGKIKPRVAAGSIGASTTAGLTSKGGEKVGFVIRLRLRRDCCAHDQADREKLPEELHNRGFVTITSNFRSIGKHNSSNEQYFSRDERLPCELWLRAPDCWFTTLGTAETSCRETHRPDSQSAISVDSSRDAGARSRNARRSFRNGGGDNESILRRLRVARASAGRG